jgi:hypothetical protein
VVDWTNFSEKDASTDRMINEQNDDRARNRYDEAVQMEPRYADCSEEVKQFPTRYPEPFPRHDR